MGQSKKSSDGQRRVWRITPGAPLGEIVDPDVPITKAPDPSSVEEMPDAAWLGSSYDLLNGLEVTETAPDELFEDLFNARSPSTSGTESRTAPAAVSKHQWILRFALRVAELDVHAEPKQVIGLARELWPTRGHLVPEEVAQAGHDNGGER